MTQQKKPPNDRIIANVQAKGYCCPLGFFCQNRLKTDTNARLAVKADVGIATIEFNKRKLKNGQHNCRGENLCQFNFFKDTYVEMRKSGEIGEPKDE